jgi:hypothetical protein
MRLEITQALLKEAFDYDPETGILRWRRRPRHHFVDDHGLNTFNTKCAGREAGYISNSGYRLIYIFGRKYLAHQLIWMMQIGKWPADQIYHRNHIRDDNRFENLCEATSAKNYHHRSIYSNNNSGFTGVGFHERSQKWMARVRIKGKLIHLGFFASKADAIAARSTVNRQHGFSKGHGLPPGVEPDHASAPIPAGTSARVAAGGPDWGE